MGTNGVSKLENRGDFVYGLSFGKACEVAAETLGVPHEEIDAVMRGAHDRIKNALASAKRPQWSVKNTSIGCAAVTVSYWHKTTTNLHDNCSDGNGVPEKGRPSGMAPGTTIQLSAIPFSNGHGETGHSLSLFI